jgi:hypothetical protein
LTNNKRRIFHEKSHQLVLHLTHLQRASTTEDSRELVCFPTIHNEVFSQR